LQLRIVSTGCLGQDCSLTLAALAHPIPPLWKRASQSQALRNTHLQSELRPA